MLIGPQKYIHLPPPSRVCSVMVTSAMVHAHTLGSPPGMGGSGNIGFHHLVQSWKPDPGPEILLCLCNFLISLTSKPDHFVFK